MKKKQFYEKPSMKVFELKLAGMLMTSGTSTVTDYTWHTEDEEARPLDVLDDFGEEIYVTNVY